jgi:hypothetical protein
MNWRPFDHLVGALLKMQWHIEAERLGGLEVDHKLELDGCLDGKFVRPRTPEDAIGIGRRAPKIIGQVNSVGQQAADLSVETVWIDSREPELGSQRGDVRAMGEHEGIRHHDQAAIRRACLCGNDGFEFGRVSNRGRDRLHCEGRNGGSE